MTLLAGFGLASSAGAKAFIPVLLLGGLHHTKYFELSDRFLWIADPAVMIVLGVLVVLEIVVDAHPDLGQYSDIVSYLPKFAAGFIGFAAAVGTLDQNLTAFAGSGLLGGGTAVGVNWLRNKVRQPFRDAAEHLHGGVGKAASLSEAGASATVAGTAVLAPPLSLLMVGGFAVAAVSVSRSIDNRRKACIHCGEPIRTAAIVCPHCRRDQVEVDIPVV